MTGVVGGAAVGASPLERVVRAALAEVPDPEIPVVSVVDLGMVGRVEAGDEVLGVELLPTFVGCPALDAIRSAVEARLAPLAGGRRVEVAFVYDPPWTTDRITAKGRARLAASGFAPPGGSAAVEAPIALDVPVPCPFCGSRRTVLENAFGPTACRSIRYCTDCRQPFEQFKTV